MSDPSRVRMSGPLEPYAPGFADQLSRLGYTPLSVCGQLRLMAHASRWLASQGLDLSGLTPAVVEELMQARRQAGYHNHRSVKAMTPLLEHLRGLGAAPTPPAQTPDTPVEQLLDRYQGYLTGERGLRPETARGYVDAVRGFLAGRVTPGGLDLASLTAGEVTTFVVSVCPGRARGSARLIVAALRSLLGFLHVDGVLPAPLAAAVPSVACWRLAGLPQPLEPAQLGRLLASCDQATPAGRRDLAVLLLLSRLGLRAGEVAGLGLDDLDWRAGQIVVAGKGPRTERLPLPADVGQAIADWLRHARPSTASDRRVFVRVKAPHRGLTAAGVTQIVAAAGRRAGLGELGAHRLRHTAATQMLAAGAPLAEIGQALRHRRASTTAIYAKVDRAALRSLARPWPGGAA